jgi:PEGA domain-containing protein
MRSTLFPWAALAPLAAAAILSMVAPASAGGEMAARTGDADVGFLDVSSDPTGAKILIDDADLGQTTPQHHLPVKVGHHRLTLVTKDGAHKLTVGFTVEAGQTKKLTLYLAK